MKRYSPPFYAFFVLAFLLAFDLPTFISAAVGDPPLQQILQCSRLNGGGQPVTSKETHGKELCGKEGVDGKQHCQDETVSTVIKQCVVYVDQCKVDGEVKEWCLAYAIPEEKPFCGDHTLYRVDQPPVFYKEHGCSGSCKKECRPMLPKPILFPVPPMK